jgi:hypothetical protein
LIGAESLSPPSLIIDFQKNQMGNSHGVSRLAADLYVSPEEEENAPNLTGLDKAELAREWKTFWVKNSIFPI